MRFARKNCVARSYVPGYDAVEIRLLLDEADCSGVRTVGAPLPNSLGALEESVLLMHVALNPGVVQ